MAVDNLRPAAAVDYLLFVLGFCGFWIFQYGSGRSQDEIPTLFTVYYYYLVKGGEKRRKDYSTALRCKRIFRRRVL